jgi:hypothetical protein
MCGAHEPVELHQHAHRLTPTLLDVTHEAATEAYVSITLDVEFVVHEGTYIGVVQGEYALNEYHILGFQLHPHFRWVTLMNREVIRRNHCRLTGDEFLERDHSEVPINETGVIEVEVGHITSVVEYALLEAIETEDEYAEVPIQGHLVAEGLTQGGLAGSRATAHTNYDVCVHYIKII